MHNSSLQNDASKKLANTFKTKNQLAAVKLQHKNVKY